MSGADDVEKRAAIAAHERVNRAAEAAATGLRLAATALEVLTSDLLPEETREEVFALILRRHDGQRTPRDRGEILTLEEKLKDALDIVQAQQDRETGIAAAARENATAVGE